MKIVIKKILAQKQWAQAPLSFAESIGSFSTKTEILIILMVEIKEKN